MKRQTIRSAVAGALALTAFLAPAINLPDLPDHDGKTVKGYVHDGTSPLAGVNVTDGFTITVTDSEGAYWLAADERADMVYISVPSGYNPPCADGISQFYKDIDRSGGVFRADFELTPADDSRHRMIVLGDPQMKDDHDHGVFVSNALPDIKAEIAAAKKEGTEVSMLVLGDICFNNPETFHRWTGYWKGIGMPMWHVPGNHDKRVDPDPARQTGEYKAAFGPLYYSFNKGNVHYLMLDNIEWQGDGNYGDGLGETQLAWVLADLKTVAPGSRVVVCAHQPITWTESSRGRHAKMLAELDKYNTLILTAHKHLGRNLDKFYDNIEERIQSALCGAYWFGDVAKDGIDLGYYIYDFTGNDLVWGYKPLKRTVDKAIRINDPRFNESDYSFTFDINVFDWDKQWTVTYKVDGQDRGTLASTPDYDPHAYELYHAHVKTWCRPVVTEHLFRCTLADGEKLLEVTATDRFGRSVSASYEVNPEFIPDRADTEVKGFVRCGDKPVADVLVTNGYEFARTNVFGIYYLPKNENARMVWLVTPAGYDAVATDGVPAFFKTIDRKDKVFQADFELVATGDDRNHNFLALADPQMRGDHDYGMFESEALPDLKATLDAMKENGTVCPVLVLGDICFDSWDTYPRYLSLIRRTGGVFYHIPGNHDKRIVTDPEVALKEYTAAFGPTYYSFNKGGVHYLMLDNVLVTARGEYSAGLTDEALAWVKADLSYVREGSRVIVCVHQPLTATKTSGTANQDLLLALSKYRTMILSAHKHYGHNLGKYALSAAPDADIEERIHSALCGAYWYGDVAKDGTPLGYYIYTAKSAGALSWQFKPLGMTVDHQFCIHEPAPFGKKLKLDVNVFDYDSNWDVTWRLDGEDKGKMYNYEAYDPHANELYADHEKDWCRPALTKHMFYGYLPADYSEVEVNVSDRFGRKYTQTLVSPAGVADGVGAGAAYWFVDGDVLYVKTGSDIMSVDVYDISGRAALHAENMPATDLSTLREGTYIVRIVVAGQAPIVGKIVVK